LIIDP